ncbi:hypothetical protein PybrP1_003105 [[Pythium] brassicae (nom. inval.)]|nr:hypothetical protein PybrP1_003105 [[Pythium] brassicae (nom. inval.)]
MFSPPTDLTSRAVSFSSPPSTSASERPARYRRVMTLEEEENDITGQLIKHLRRRTIIAQQNRSPLQCLPHHGHTRCRRQPLMCVSVDDRIDAAWRSRVPVLLNRKHSVQRRLRRQVDPELRVRELNAERLQLELMLGVGAAAACLHQLVMEQS